MTPVQRSSQNYLSFPSIAGHNAWLDALRAFAIVLVLLRHGVRIDAAGFNTGGFVHNVYANGWIGVDLFFVLSGYLIAKSLLKRVSVGQPLFDWQYFKRRILRIVPAYYAVLLLCVIGFFPFFAMETAGLEARVFYHAFFLQDYLGADINVVFWSLGVEEKFYLLVPLLILALVKINSNRWQWILCIALITLSPLARCNSFLSHQLPIDYSTFFSQLRSPFHMSLDGFVVGIMAALTQWKGWLLPPRIAMPVLAICFVGTVAWAGSHEFLASITLFDAIAQPLILALVFGLMLSACVSLAQTPLPFEPTARVIARLSYTLYLVHFPLIPIAYIFTAGWGPKAFWIAYLSFSLLASIALHFMVEKPFLNLMATSKTREHFAGLKTMEAR